MQYALIMPRDDEKLTRSVHINDVLLFPKDEINTSTPSKKSKPKKL